MASRILASVRPPHSLNGSWASSPLLASRQWSSSPLKSFMPHSRGHTRLSPPSSLPRFYSSSPASSQAAKASPSSFWTKTAIGGTIALATSATLFNQLTKAPQMEASAHNNSSSLTGGNVVQDLKDEHNRIGVEKKSTSDLLLSMLVYKLCTFSLLVDLAPKIIHLAEMVHLTPPVYWVVRKTFFAQFCG